MNQLTNVINDIFFNFSFKILKICSMGINYGEYGDIKLMFKLQFYEIFDNYLVLWTGALSRINTTLFSYFN